MVRGRTLGPCIRQDQVNKKEGGGGDIFRPESDKKKMKNAGRLDNI